MKSYATGQVVGTVEKVERHPAGGVLVVVTVSSGWTHEVIFRATLARWANKNLAIGVRVFVEGHLRRSYPGIIARDAVVLGCSSSY